MKPWNSVNDILDYAISEEVAAEFYTQLSQEANSPGMREIFQNFAEEQGHKAKLQAIKAGNALTPAKQPVLDLKIADYMVEAVPGPATNYQGALVVAMKKEKAAFKLYSDLAAEATDETVKATFLALAQEEAKHKLRFEIEYDNLLTEG